MKHHNYHHNLQIMSCTWDHLSNIFNATKTVVFYKCGDTNFEH